MPFPTKGWIGKDSPAYALCASFEASLAHRCIAVLALLPTSGRGASGKAKP